MFSIDNGQNKIPIVVIRGETPLEGEIIFMKKNRDDDHDSRAEEKPRRRQTTKKAKLRKKKGGRVRFADYNDFEDEMPSERSEDDSQAESEVEQSVSDEMDAIKIDSGKLELLPTTEERQRDNIYVCGRSGSGKSTWTRNFIKNYIKLKKNPVYVFSALDSDPALDDLKISRIILDEDIVNNPIEPAELRDSLCVFDDIDSLSDPKVKKAVIDLQDKCLEIGRHSNISMVNTAHKICDYRRSRTLLNEASHIVIFPARGNNLTRYFLDKYSGLDKNNIKRIYNNKSRWTALQINHPGFILTEKELYLPE